MVADSNNGARINDPTTEYRIHDTGYLIKLFNVMPGHLERVAAAEAQRVAASNVRRRREAKQYKRPYQDNMLAHLVCLGDYDLLSIAETRELYDLSYEREGEILSSDDSGPGTNIGEFLLHSSNLFGYRFVPRDAEVARKNPYTLDIRKDLLAIEEPGTGNPGDVQDTQQVEYKAQFPIFCLFTFMKLNNSIYQSIFNAADEKVIYLTELLNQECSRLDDQLADSGCRLRYMNSTGLYERIFFLLGNNLKELLQHHLDIRRRWRFDDKEIFNKTYTIPAMNYRLFSDENPVFDKKDIPLKKEYADALKSIGKPHKFWFYSLDEKVLDHVTGARESDLSKSVKSALGFGDVHDYPHARITCSSLAGHLYEYKDFFNRLPEIVESVSDLKDVAAYELVHDDINSITGDDDQNAPVFYKCSYQLGDKDVSINLNSDAMLWEVLATVFTLRLNAYSRINDQVMLCPKPGDFIPRFIPVLNTSIRLDFNKDVPQGIFSESDDWSKYGEQDHPLVYYKNVSNYTYEGGDIPIGKLMAHIEEVNVKDKVTTSHTYKLTITRLVNMLKHYNCIVSDPTKRDLISDMLRFFRIVPKLILTDLLERLAINKDSYETIDPQWFERVTLNHFMLGVLPTVLDSVDWGLRQRFEGNFPTTVDYITGERGQTLRGGLQKILVACNVFMREYVNNSMRYLFYDSVMHNTDSIYGDPANYRDDAYQRILESKDDLPDDYLWSGFNTFGMTNGFGLLHYQIIDFPQSSVFTPTRWLYGLHEGGHLIWSKIKYWLREWADRSINHEYLTAMDLPTNTYPYLREERILHEVMAEVISYALGHKLSWRHFISTWSFLAQSSIVSPGYWRNWEGEILRTYFIYYLNKKMFECRENPAEWKMTCPSINDIEKDLDVMMEMITYILSSSIKAFPSLSARDIKRTERIEIINKSDLEHIARAIYARVNILNIIDSVLPIKRLLRDYGARLKHGINKEDYDPELQPSRFERITEGVVMTDLSSDHDTSVPSRDNQCIELCQYLYDWTRVHIENRDRSSFFSVYLAAILSIYKKSYQMQEYQNDIKDWNYLHNC